MIKISPTQDLDIAWLDASNNTTNNGWNLGEAANLVVTCPVVRGWLPTEGGIITATIFWSDRANAEENKNSLRLLQESRKYLNNAGIGTVRTGRLSDCAAKINADQRFIEERTARLKTYIPFYKQVRRLPFFAAYDSNTSLVRGFHCFFLTPVMVDSKKEVVPLGALFEVSWE